ncbi:hypothetical protein V1525DRAFT_390626 [Lipomyces kononenkoae]|uniref:Uncharacterized protein n=1 Tax=Lipomyces kononenkoae TaxID=34357 RepID=A0ACC3SV25_LIPKO
MTGTRCHHIVDKSMVEDHLTKVRKLEIQDKACAIRAYRLRPHLSVDDGFESGAFRQGAAAVEGVTVFDGYKCVLCESALQHRCVQSKEAMRTHSKRNHPNPVRIQVVYGRSAANPQLRYVEVAEDNTTAAMRETDDITMIGIPATVHGLSGAHTAVADNRDRDQFGRAFYAYKLLEWLGLAELELLHNPFIPDHWALFLGLSH